LGSTVATAGVVMPSIIIMIIISKFFFKFKNNKYVEYAFLGLRPSTVGLVAAAAILVAYGSFIDYKSVVIFALAFFASYKYKMDPILLTVVAGIVGYILY
jgi:chromate transporter